MSRAFVKERDDEPAIAFAAPEAPHDVTPGGLRRLRERLASAVDAERPALERRVAAARPAELPADERVIAFGASVTFRESNGTLRSVHISGEDDVDISAGRIGPDSPLAQALLGRRAGQRALWRRPAGDERITIVALDYGELR